MGLITNGIQSPLNNLRRLSEKKEVYNVNIWRMVLLLSGIYHGATGDKKENITQKT